MQINCEPYEEATSNFKWQGCLTCGLGVAFYLPSGPSE